MIIDILRQLLKEVKRPQIHNEARQHLPIAIIGCCSQRAERQIPVVLRCSLVDIAPLDAILAPGALPGHGAQRSTTKGERGKGKSE